MLSRRLVPALALVALIGLGACSSDRVAEASPRPAGEAGAATVATEGAVVVDVRTPEEYAAGHVEGAVLIDVSDPSFAGAVAELDPDDEYLVYCRSGNRSAVAAEIMRAAGLTVTDGGALDDMRAAGWPVTG